MSDRFKTDELGPTQIGSFRVLGSLGSGGQGEVWRAVDEDGREVAIKTLQHRTMSRLQELRHEVQILERLHHPYVVRVLGYDFAGDVPWYAMELVEGWSLHNVLFGSREDVKTSVMPARSSSPLRNISTREVVVEPPTTDVGLTGEDHAYAYHDTEELPPFSPSPTTHQLRALEVIAALCTTLSYVHGEGVVHCDLKPGNVVLGPDGYPVLVDFGLSGRFAHTHRESIDVGRAVMGTAHYMSPEQIQGQRVDARADLYAIGCILYEVITGSPPFSAASSMAVMVMHLGARPQPPSHAAPWARGVLDELVMSLLEREPHRRLGFADEVRSRLRAFLDPAEPLKASKPLPASQPVLYRAPFVGRAAEFEGVRELLAQTAHRKGRGTPPHLVRVEGAQGVGKTRFAQEIVQEARTRDVWVCVHRCREHGPLLGAFSALLDLVADLLATEPERLRAVSTQALNVLSTFHERVRSGLCAREGGPIPPPVPLDARNTIHRLTAAVVEILQAIAEHTACLLVLDDLHWADPLSRDVLAGVLRGRCDLQGRWMLLTLEREGDEGVGAFWREHQNEPDLAVRLTDLDRDALGALVEGVTAARDVDQDVIDAVYAKTAGNPFFACQLLEEAAQRSLMQRARDGYWVFDGFGSGASLPMPSQLIDLLRARISRLSDASLRVLRSLALFEEGCSDDVLQAAAVMARQDFLRALSDLLAVRILEPEQFAHRVLSQPMRTLILASLDTEQHNELYRCAAVALERFAPDSAARAEELARFWLQANEPTRSLPHVRRALDQALGVFQLDEARRWGLCFLKYCINPDDTAEVSALLAKHVFSAQGHYDEALEAWGRAATIARNTDNGALLSRICAEWADVARVHGDILEAIALCEEGEAAGKRAQALPERVRCACIHGRIVSSQGRFDEAERLFKKAVALAERASNWSLLNEILHIQGLTRWHQGKRQEALRILTQAFRKLDGNEDALERRAYLAGRLAGLERELGNLDRSHRFHQECISLHKRVGNLVDYAIALGNYATTLLATGRRQEALDTFNTSIPILRQANCRPALAFALGTRANTLFELGRFDGVLHDLQTTATIQEESRSPFYLAFTLLALMRYEQLVHANLAQARVYFQRASDILHGFNSPYEVAYCHTLHAHLSLAEGDISQATASLHSAQELMNAHIDDFGPELRDGITKAQNSLHVAQTHGLQALHNGMHLDDLPDPLADALRALTEHA